MSRDRSELRPEAVREAAIELDAHAVARLAERFADRKVVLLGEATHGTSEFYMLRARITRHLIAEHGFSFVGVEGDWPACARLNAFVGGEPFPMDGDGAAAALRAFDRWPTWMWANWETAAFARWLERHNRESPAEKAAFYGLDVYSLHASLEIVVDYLVEHRPDAVETAREAFACFEPYRRSGTDYPDVRLVPQGCEDEVVALLRALRSDADDGAPLFDAEQNARVALNAERYYRAALRGGAESWNVRDRHMQETLENLLQAHGPQSKAVVWAHNTHVGDARFTDMATAGMVNLGQLARERFGRTAVASIGFGTHRGTVIAGSGWGATPERMEVPPAADGSWEDVFHRAGGARTLLLSEDVRDEEAFAQPRDHRAIGVVYRPARERFGNYVPTVLPERYDAFVHVDATRALHPIDVDRARDAPPELAPWGF